MMSVLQDAFREAVRREFASVPLEHEIHWKFSEDFLTKMHELLSGYPEDRNIGTKPIEEETDGSCC